MFKFCGEISASKSIFNRALIVQSYFPDLKLTGKSDSEDVLHLMNSLSQINDDVVLNAGMGGTTFRFLALRLSRLKNKKILTAHHRLFERPQQELWDLFHQLQIDYQIHNNQVEIFGHYWLLKNKTIEISCDKSTQFASAFLLNCWLLPEEVHLRLNHVALSKDYLEMTVTFLSQLGMVINIDRQGNQFEIRIAPNQKINRTVYPIESDMSSLATLAMAAVIDGELNITNFPSQSLQPDFQFLNYFDQMKIDYQIINQSFHVTKQTAYGGLHVDLQQTPDLFPCLAILAAFAQGESSLFGVPQLKHKESDRLKKTTELLDFIGCGYEIKNDGIAITRPVCELKKELFLFNPDHDHRMAMAAGLLKLKGYQIQIQDTSVLNKSFSNFFELIGV